MPIYLTTNHWSMNNDMKKEPQKLLKTLQLFFFFGCSFSSFVITDDCIKVYTFQNHFLKSK